MVGSAGQVNLVSSLQTFGIVHVRVLLSYYSQIPKLVTSDLSALCAGTEQSSAKHEIYCYTILTFVQLALWVSASLWWKASYIASAAATEAFKELILPRIGIEIR